MRSEFEFIDYIKDRYTLRKVGDDCAVLPKDAATDIVITADMLVEDIDFRVDWTAPELLGHKALAVSLSDIAAMGAEPKWAMISLAVPRKTWSSSFVDEFYRGWFRLAEQFQIELVGGDTSRTGAGIVIDSVVGGEVRRGTAIRRSGATAGNGVFVSGCLGGAAGGLRLLEGGSRSSTENNQERALIDRQLAPFPRVALGTRLNAGSGVTAMIDLSDGISSDLGHICKASGVGAMIDASLLPVDENLEMLGVGPDEILQMALNGGEDFELLFTVDEKKLTGADLAGCTRIGSVTASIGRIELISGGETTVLPAGGYRHF
jgi:thiamine-monophosphate kinase